MTGTRKDVCHQLSNLTKKSPSVKTVKIKHSQEKRREGESVHRPNLSQPFPESVHRPNPSQPFPESVHRPNLSHPFPESVHPPNLSHPSLRECAPP